MQAFFKLEKFDKIKSELAYTELKIRKIRVIRGYNKKSAT